MTQPPNQRLQTDRASQPDAASARRLKRRSVRRTRSVIEMRREEYLEPMVLAAIEGKRNLPRPKRPKPQGASLKDMFVRGVRDDIEDLAAVQPSTVIISEIKLRFPAASEEDIQDAITAANALQQIGLFIESGYGDNEGAVKELEREVPGFSYELYRNVISYFGYINH
jgi:hypothetical protein